MRSKALTAAKHAGGVVAAMFHSPATDSPLYLQLESMYIQNKHEMKAVEVGTKLRNQRTRQRFILVDLGYLVDLDTGVSIGSYSLAPYPLEIYHYAN